MGEKTLTCFTKRSKHFWLHDDDDDDGEGEGEEIHHINGISTLSSNDNILNEFSSTEKQIIWSSHPVSHSTERASSCNNIFITRT